MSRHALPLVVALALGLLALPSAAQGKTSIAQVDSDCTQINAAEETRSWSKVSAAAAGDWRLSGSIGGTKLDKTWAANTWFEGNVLVEEIKHNGALAYRSLTGVGASIWASSSSCESIKGSLEVDGDWLGRKMEGGNQKVDLEYYRYEPPSGCKGAGKPCDPETDCCPGDTACPSTEKCPG